MKVEPREKLGICGRTGAGKSSLLNVLLRIVDPCGGKCTIDDVDVTSVGLHCLRRSITVLPQDPVRPTTSEKSTSNNPALSLCTLF
eukprot:5449536-Amphidinium_carterae.1